MLHLFRFKIKQIIVASDDAAADYFGFLVSISGGVVMVGAYMDGDGSVNSGSAYVFEKSGSTWP